LPSPALAGLARVSSASGHDRKAEARPLRGLHSGLDGVRLDQEFNSLDAQQEAAEAYIRSQAHDGWTLVRARYDDGGYSGGSTEPSRYRNCLADIRGRRIDVVVVYKVDRLTRSLADFAKLVELFDAHGVSFVSVTQQFNTTTSTGRGVKRLWL
jgi:site-specific DNA recombinase